MFCFVLACWGLLSNRLYRGITAVLTTGQKCTVKVMNFCYVFRSQVPVYSTGLILGFNRMCSQSLSGPLSGIRILDMTRILAGPFATMILGDLGAEVIKVEKIRGGDDTRSWGPPFLGSESCYFLSVNRNKCSIAIDMKHEEGASILQRLAKKSDILIENFIPGTLDRYNLDYTSLSASAPHLIYCSLTGYGSTGPYHKRPGYDVIAASVGGLVGVTGPEAGEPCKVGVAVTDLAAGLYAHGAIMAAIIERQRTGLGQRIECNLLSTQVSCMVNLASNYLNGEKVAKRWGTAHESIVPYEAFSTKDGYLTIGAGNDDQFVALCQRLNLNHLLELDCYKTNALRVKNRHNLTDVLRRTFQLKNTEDWLVILEGAPFPYGPINSLEEVFSDPQVIHNDLVQVVPHETVGSIKSIRPAVKYTLSNNSIRLPPPVLGQHTHKVLSDLLDYSGDALKNLQDRGIIYCSG